MFWIFTKGIDKVHLFYYNVNIQNKEVQKMSRKKKKITSQDITTI